jgi:hypothetical protein
MAIEYCKDLKRSKSEEAVVTPSSTTQNTHEYHAGQNEVNHKYEQEDTPGLDLGEHYIALMQEAMEERFSKPRSGHHVTDIVMCARQRVYREIDPVPIGAKTVSIFSAGKAIHGSSCSIGGRLKGRSTWNSRIFRDP